MALNTALIATAIALALMGMRRALFLAVLVPIAFVPFSYARLRLHAYLRQTLVQVRPGALALGTFAALGLVLDAVMVGSLLTARSETFLPLLHRGALSWVGPIWFSAHALLAVAYGLGALGRRLARAGRWLATRRRESLANDSTPDFGRREFVQRLGLVGAGVPFAVSLTSAGTSYDFRVEEREIVLPHWPRALDGLRVAHLSDIHVGGAMDRRRLLRVAALTNAARPDLVAHTGDFLTHRGGDFDAPLYEALARIRAPYGQWACLGNHDYDNPNRLVQRLAGAGVVALRDAAATIGIEGTALEIAGLEYLRPAGREARFARAVASWGARRGTPRILLNHDPTGFPLLPADCTDLVLSGHTHGGHIGVQFGPSTALTLVGLVGIPDQGFFQRGNMWLYVTRCVGFYGYPLRIGIPPEIAILTLRSPGLTTASRS